MTATVYGPTPAEIAADVAAIRADMAAAAPIPVGALVHYHGARTSRHGFYRIRAACMCRPNRLEDCQGRYRLAEVDRSSHGLAHIHPDDFTVITENFTQ